ncbi:hypothetical protein [Streptomyces sp. NPDC048172]|uniref:hypothetical protein n=1 Tax=Streptomyces sp. NPDC048172 TaxID=3365505 RepID=UPI0037156ACD
MARCPRSRAVRATGAAGGQFQKRAEGHPYQRGVLSGDVAKGASRCRPDGRGAH